MPAPLATRPTASPNTSAEPEASKLAALRQSADSLEDNFVLSDEPESDSDESLESSPESEPESSPEPAHNEPEQPTKDDKEAKRERRARERAKLAAKRAKQNPPTATVETLETPEAVAEFWAGVWNCGRRNHALALSQLEIDEVRIPPESVLLPAWHGPRSDARWAEFLAAAWPEHATNAALSAAGGGPGRRMAKGGALRVVIVCSSAIRCVEVIRAIKQGTLAGVEAANVPQDGPAGGAAPKRRRFGRNGGRNAAVEEPPAAPLAPFANAVIGKLFAKHFKAEEQSQFLSQHAHDMVIAVGTPNRLWKLAREMRSLALNGVTHLILDASYRDSKQCGLFDDQARRRDLYNFARDCLSMRLKSGKARLVAF